MKLRILTAVALVPVLLAVILVAPTVLTAILVGILCVIAAYELLQSLGLKKQMRLLVYTALSAFYVPLWCHTGMVWVWGLLGLLVFLMLILSELLLSESKLRLERLSICVMAGLVIPLFLSALVRILNGIHGRELILVPFVVAFLSDSGAYFIGSRFGKRKLAPKISPNKSVEGAVAGVVTAILGMLIYCVVVDLAFEHHVNYLYAITYGIVGSIAGIFGDLCFSAIKRQTGIKDYGNIFPGHGGILDRFDSMVIVAPLVEIMLILLPVLE